MSLWQHLLGKVEISEGRKVGVTLASGNRRLGYQELGYFVDRYGIDRAAKFFKGVVLGYNQVLLTEKPAHKYKAQMYANPYQLGQYIAEKEMLLPSKSLSSLIKGSSIFYAKSSLRLLTDGYNDRVKELKQKKKSPKKEWKKKETPEKNGQEPDIER